MTLIIAAPGKDAPGKDFILLGADSRGTVESGMGRIEINTMQKLIPVTEFTAVLIYGSSEVTNHLVEKFISERANDLKWIKEVAAEFSAFCQEEERRLAGVPKHPDSIDDIFGFIIAGLEENENGHKAYAYHLSSYDGFRQGLCRPYAIEGKPLIALYMFAKEYEENLTQDKLCQLVAQSIYDTERVDGDVGGRIKLAIIDSDGLREIPNNAIDDYIEYWKGDGLEKIR